MEKPARPSLSVAVGAALLALLLGLAGLGLTACGSSPEEPPEIEVPADGQSDAQKGSDTESHALTSTPMDQWRKGEYPHLYQTDPAWASQPYGGGTIETYGCGPTALAMVYIGLTGKTDQTPATIASYAESSGYLENGQTTSALMSVGAQGLGLDGAREFPVSTEELMAELEAGHPVIANVGPGDFTSGGHYIVLTGLDGNGDIIVNDPNSEENSERTWSPFQILRQTKFLWTYS